MTRRQRRFLLAAAVLLAAAAAVALLLRPRPIPLETAQVTRGPLAVTLEEEGETRIRSRHLVAAPVAGRLLRIPFEEGDRVAAGQAMAVIEPVPLDPRTREQAESALRAARAGAAEADARVAEAAAAAEQARRHAERIERLGAEEQVSREQVEEARTARETAGKGLAAARFAAEAARCREETARAALLGATPGSPSRRLEVCSPVDGLVLRVLERSERVVAAGTPLVEVGDPADLEVVVDVLSTDAVGIEPGAALRLEVGDGVVLPGRVRFVEPAAFTEVSPLGVEEQRVHVIGDVLPAGPAAADGTAALGPTESGTAEFGPAELPAAAPRLGDRYRVVAHVVLWEEPDVLRVPTGALFRRGEGWAVFVVEGDRVRLRAVEIGHRGPDHAQVLAGLAAGDTVALYPPDRLVDGGRVEVRSP